MEGDVTKTSTTAEGCRMHASSQPHKTEHKVAASGIRCIVNNEFNNSLISEYCTRTVRVNINAMN